MSGGAGSELAESGKKSGGSAGVVEGIEGDGGGELRRLGPEADLEDVLLADGHQGVQFGSGILFPVSACSEYDGTGLVDVPFALVALARIDAAAVGAPSMTADLKMKAGRSAKIGFEGKGFFLVVPAAENPLNRQSARAKLHGDVSVFEAAGREVQTGTKTGAVEPMRFEDAAFSGACGLYPAESLSSPSAIVGGEQEIPGPEGSDRADNVDN